MDRSMGPNMENKSAAIPKAVKSNPEIPAIRIQPLDFFREHISKQKDFHCTHLETVQWLDSDCMDFRVGFQ